jgi:hypothetical protein
MIARFCPGPRPQAVTRRTGRFDQSSAAVGCGIELWSEIFRVGRPSQCHGDWGWLRAGPGTASLRPAGRLTLRNLLSSQCQSPPGRVTYAAPTRAPPAAAGGPPGLEPGRRHDSMIMIVTVMMPRRHWQDDSDRDRDSGSADSLTGSARTQSHESLAT